MLRFLFLFAASVNGFILYQYIAKDVTPGIFLVSVWGVYTILGLFGEFVKLTIQSKAQKLMDKYEEILQSKDLTDTQKSEMLGDMLTNDVNVLLKNQKGE